MTTEHRGSPGSIQILAAGDGTSVLPATLAGVFGDLPHVDLHSVHDMEGLLDGCSGRTPPDWLILDGGLVDATPADALATLRSMEMLPRPERVIVLHDLPARFQVATLHRLRVRLIRRPFSAITPRRMAALSGH